MSSLSVVVGSLAPSANHTSPAHRGKREGRGEREREMYCRWIKRGEGFSPKAVLGVDCAFIVKYLLGFQMHWPML
jgi:hypothetical protein